MQSSHPILNLAGYQFIPLPDVNTLKESLFSLCSRLHIVGTILLSHEGINMNLAALPQELAAFKAALRQDSRFTDMRFHETYSASRPFKRLKVKIKPEIITLKQDAVQAEYERAPAISPHELQTWLDEKRDVVLLDTRNDYEVRFGTFAGAHHLQINDFSHFPASLQTIPKDKPVVMFCTGGIRCEKAALYMLQQGYEDVYQLDGGILGYFAQVGGRHYQGECFVFDERIAVDATLAHTGTQQCAICQGPVTSRCERCTQALAG